MALFGWELVFKSVEKDIRRKEDVLVAFTHWFLLKMGFSCVGMGTSRNLTGKERKSEILPSEWNETDDFNLRYVYDGKLYLFRAIVNQEDIIFNFLRGEDLCISSCLFRLDESVKEIRGNAMNTMHDFKKVMKTLEKDLISPVFVRPINVVATQTPEQPSHSRQDSVGSSYIDPLRAPPRRPLVIVDPVTHWNPLSDPRAIGRNDVDPFGQGGGMLFDPFRPRRDPRGPGPNFPDGLPRGAVPPGARYDPFAPPGTGRGGRPDPDPDHLPPPGYDDMFM